MTYETDNYDGPNPDLESVGRDMLSSFKDSLGADWIRLRPDMEKHIEGVRESIAYIGELQVQGELTEEGARELIEFQQLNMKMLIIECSAMKDLAIETAINSAFKKVRDAVNSMVNFELL
jgi:hypothetical protein